MSRDTLILRCIIHQRRTTEPRKTSNCWYNPIFVSCVKRLVLTVGVLRLTRIPVGILMICICVCIYIYMHVCICLYIHTYIHVYFYVLPVCMSVCVYIPYIYIYTQSTSCSCVCVWVSLSLASAPLLAPINPGGQVITQTSICTNTWSLAGYSKNTVKTKAGFVADRSLWSYCM